MLGRTCAGLVRGRDVLDRGRRTAPLIDRPASVERRAERQRPRCVPRPTIPSTQRRCSPTARAESGSAAAVRRVGVLEVRMPEGARSAARVRSARAAVERRLPSPAAGTQLRDDRSSRSLVEGRAGGWTGRHRRPGFDRAGRDRLRRLSAVPPAFEITARDGAARAGRDPHAPRRRAHARVRPARVHGDGQVAARRRGRRARLRHGARQHVPPVHPAGRRADRRDGRPARVHGLARGDRHRLRRLPGVLDGPRLGGRGDQAPARAPHLDDRLDRGGGRSLPLLPRRRRALHGPRDLDGGAGGARLGHRAGVRRVHALPRRARLHRALDGAHPPLARPLRELARRARARRASCSTGSSRAASTRTCARDRPPTSPRPACRASRSAARSASRRSRCARCVGWSLRDLPDEPPRHLLGIGDVDDLVHARRRGHRHLRLRHAHAAGAPRHRARATTRPTAGGSTSARPVHRTSTRADRRDAASARPAASTRAATCTTWSGRAS